MTGNYILRFAAGMYWLLDVAQPGIPYKEPIAINEVGADIFKLLQDGYTETEIISWISSEYGIGQELAAEDVKAFCSQLQQEGIEV